MMRQSYGFVRSKLSKSMAMVALFIGLFGPSRAKQGVESVFISNRSLNLLSAVIRRRLHEEQAMGKFSLCCVVAMKETRRWVGWAEAGARLQRAKEK
jgi:hypothetical protein